jgi:hypothetical protein
MSLNLKQITHPHFSESLYVLSVKMVGVGSYVPISAVCYPVGMLMCQPVPDILSFAYNHNITQIPSIAVQLSHADWHLDRKTDANSRFFKKIAKAHVKGEGTFVLSTS